VNDDRDQRHVPDGWPAGDALIISAWIWLAQKYERLPEPRPRVSGPQWVRMEAEMDEAYALGRMEALRQAVRRYCRFAIDQWNQDSRNVA